MYIHIYIYIYKQLHTYIHKYVYRHSCIRTYIHRNIHIYVHTYIHACITYLHTYFNTYIDAWHIYIETKMYKETIKNSHIGHTGMSMLFMVCVCMNITLRQCSNNICDLVMCFISHNFVFVYINVFVQLLFLDKSQRVPGSCRCAYAQWDDEVRVCVRTLWIADVSTTMQGQFAGGRRRH